MLLDMLRQLEDTRNAIIRTTHATQTLDVVTEAEIAEHGQIDMLTFEKGLRLLRMSGRVCTFDQTIALPIHEQAKLRPTSREKICRDWILQAIKEYFPSSRLKAGDVIKVHTLFGFLPDCMTFKLLDEGLRWLDAECRCITATGIKLTPELLAKLVVTRTNYLN